MLPMMPGGAEIKKKLIGATQLRRPASFSDHAQYLASWLAVLKADKRAIFTAASKATEAAAFLAALQSA